VEQHLVAAPQHRLGVAGGIEEEVRPIGCQHGGEVVSAGVVLAGVALQLGGGEGRQFRVDTGDVPGLAHLGYDLADVEGPIDDGPAAGGAEDPDLWDQVPQGL